MIVVYIYRYEPLSVPDAAHQNKRTIEVSKSKNLMFYFSDAPYLLVEINLTHNNHPFNYSFIRIGYL